jgi:N-acetylglucosamine repressor
VGVDLGVSRARIVCVNLLAEVICEDEVPAAAVPDKEALLHYIERTLDAFGVDRRILIGMGCAAPGSPNPRPQEPQRAHYLDEYPWHHWQRDGVDKLLMERFGVPAWMENDANAAVLGEMWFGEGSNAGHLLFVIGDEGVGAGIAVNGSIFRGEHNVAGEFSHMIINADRDVECGCGRPGCLSSLARPGAIYQALERAGVSRARRERPLRDILASARAGEEPERSVVSNVFSYMSAGIVNIVDVIDPGMVVLGGSFFESDPYTVTEVRQRVQEVMNPKVIRVVQSAFGVNAVAVGAATLALQHVYDHTKVMHPADASSEVALVTV